MNEKSNAVPAISSLQSSAPEIHRFERLEADLARALVRVSVDEIDAEINRWLKGIMTSLGLDRSTIAEINPVTGLARFTHGWACQPERIIGSATQHGNPVPPAPPFLFRSNAS